MIRKLAIDIEVDFDFPDYCSDMCDYLDNEGYRWGAQCSMFNTMVKYGVLAHDNKFIRCQKCIEKEIK